MTKQLLGFVGVGRMGIHMAGGLLEAGHRLAVYDIKRIRQLIPSAPFTRLLLR
jgi:3-hydroxyisobutyrate dehydrogenase-like beta-hydroxyacid dehydrogenase